jgi:2-dehydropantoate 2-reductase
MKIAVVGIGAVGGYFGGRLAAAREYVTFVARGETLAALRSGGLRVDSPRGDLALENLNATDSPEAVGPADLVILAVKAWQIPDVARAIQPMVDERTAILPLQNGVEAPEQLAAVLGRDRVLGGTCAIIAMKVGPNHVRHIAVDPLIALGELDNRPTDRISRIIDVLSGAGVSARNPSDIGRSIWKKFLYVAPVSGVGAVSRCPIGSIRDSDETRELLTETIEEVYSLAIARGIPLASDAVEQTLAEVDRMPPDSTTSTQRDIMAGRPSELDALTGAVVRLGRESGVETPANRFIYDTLLPQEIKAREA